MLSSTKQRGLRTLLSMMEVMQPAFTRPGFRNAWVIFSGWVLTMGVHAVTQALVATDVARRLHHERFHRFFSRGSWKPDEVGKLIFHCIVEKLCPEGRIRLVLDDTLSSSKGAEIFGIGSHLDAVRSTKRFRVFCFGHVWVTLSVVVRVPFSSRPWALPVLFRLYRNKGECQSRGDTYAKKTELGRQMVDTAVQWANGRLIDLAVDSAYCNDTLIRGLSETVTVIGAIRPDAVLTAAPTLAEQKKSGRRRKRGALLPKPQELYADTRVPWKRIRLELYGESKLIHYKTIEAQWYRGAGARLGRIVIVRIDDGAIRMRVFFCTDPERDVPDVLLTYSGRWSTEVCYRDLKQHMGFADSSARKKEAVERTAPFVGYIYSLLVLWFADSIWTTSLATPPIRPWYRHRKHASFADIVRAAQRLLLTVDVLDPARGLNNLGQLADDLKFTRYSAPKEAA